MLAHKRQRPKPQAKWCRWEPRQRAVLPLCPVWPTRPLCTLLPPTNLTHPQPPCAGLGLTALVVLALRLGAGSFSDADGWDALGGDFTFGAGDALGALLWGTSLYFCSPLQVGFEVAVWEVPLAAARVATCCRA